MDSYRENQQQAPPIECAGPEKVISGILADDSLIVGKDGPEEFLIIEKQLGQKIPRGEAMDVTGFQNILEHRP